MSDETQPNEQELWKLISETEGEERAEVLVFLSYLARNKGDFRECLALCETARDLYEDAGSKIGNAALANVYKGISHSLRHLNRPADAAIAIDRTIDLYREIGSSEAITAIRNEASAWYDAKNYEKSLEFCVKALKEPNPDCEKVDLGRDLYHLSEAYLKLERWQEALQALLSGRQHFKESGHVVYVAYCDEDISECYYKLNNGMEALNHAQKALDFAVTSRDENRLYWANARMAYAKKLLDELDEAESYFEKALTIIHDGGEPEWKYVIEVEQQLAGILLAKGDPQGASAIYRRLRTLEETLT